VSHRTHLPTNGVIGRRETRLYKSAQTFNFAVLGPTKEK
jgi:hypothetical protein